MTVNDVRFPYEGASLPIDTQYEEVRSPESCHFFGFWVFGWVFWRVCAGGVWEKGY